MKKHKSRGLALLLAVAMVFQFCIFSSQSAWAGNINVDAASEEQMQDTGTAPEGDAALDDSQEAAPVDEAAEEVTTDSEEPGVSDVEEPEAVEEETPAEQTEDDEEPAAEQEQPAENTEEEPAENTDMPARILTGYADGVNVFVTAEEGAFDKDVRMVVKKVGKADTEKALNAADKVIDDMIYTIKAVDITFVDKDGNEVQPAKPVQVDLRTAVQDENATREVVHIQDNGKAEVMEGVDFGTKKAVFEADHFSIYAIVETGDDARLLVKFCKPDGSLIDSMYVKKNDDLDVVLYDPGAGELSGGVYFRGWTTEQNYTPETQSLSIADVRTAVGDMLPPASDGTEITYYAMLFKDYRITYLDENNISLGQEEVTFRADAPSAEQSYKVNMAYTVQNENYHFEGWNVNEGSSNIVGYEDRAYQNNETITITGDVTFGVFAPEGHWFIFDENGKGATYTAPQFVYSADKPTPPNAANMIRNGYTFGGWYADKATADQTSGGTQYSFDQTLTDKTTVYARWIPKTTANYTIIIWKQNLAGDGYDFVESISKTGNVGSTINTVRYQNNNLQIQRNGNTWSTVSYTGFHYKSFDQNVTIKTEGNSVLNVYFDRNEHTLQFQVEMQSDYTYTPTTSNDGTQYGLVDGEYVQLTRHNEGSWNRPRYYWTYGDTWFGEGTRYTGTRYTRSGGGMQWTTIKEIKALYGQSIGDNFPIVGTNGVTYDQGERWMPQNSSTYSNVLVYIDVMPDESVTFRLNEASHSTKHIYYYVEALPGETGPTVTYNGKAFVLHKDVAANYGFFTEAEDYIDFAGFTKFGYTPSNAWGSGGADTVYCYYTRNVYTINFMDGKYVDGDNNPIEEDGMGQISTETGIAYGTDVSSRNSYVPDTDHTPSGYVFEGWYIDSACTQKYTFDKMPDGGITVYAKWRQKQYRVFLHVNYPDGATGNINWGTANQSMTFRVSEGGHVSEPTGRDLAGYAFDGWYLDEDYTQVFNGEAYVINENSVTTPYNKQTDYTDTYDNNGILGDPKKNSDLTGWDDDGDETTPGKERFWITKKLDIYAKWHSTLEGASGIVVEYDADANSGGYGAPTDTHTYVDTAKAPAGAASKTTDTSKVFGYWEVQKWENGAWTGTGTKVLPGDTFTVLKSNAKVEDLPTPAPNGDTKKYTVQLKAVYIDSEAPTPTHIYWYKNDGTDAFDKKENVEINVGVDIPAAPTREGYTFLGWSRVDIGNTQAAASAWEVDSHNWTQNLTASNLYLTYEDGAYTIAGGTTVTQVAPDENLPYHAMFAVWQPKLQVRVTGSTDTKPYNGSEQSVDGYTVEYKEGDGEWTTTAPDGVSVALADGKTAEAKGTDVDEYPMGLTKDHFVVTAPAGKYAYDPEEDLEVTDGSLTITPVDVTVTIVGANDTSDYDGEEHVVTGYTAEASSTLYDVTKDFTFTPAEGAELVDGEIAAKRTNAGTTYMGLAGDQFKNINPNFGTVTFQVTDGYQTINKINVTVTITGHHNTTTYDGQEHVVSGYDVEISNTLYKETDFTFTPAADATMEEGKIAAKRTNQGKTNMGLAADQFANTNSNFETVTFNVTDGYQEITPVEEVVVTITGHHNTTNYDGQEHVVSGYDVEISNPLYKETDFTFTPAAGATLVDGEIAAKRTDAGTTNMGLTPEQFTNNNSNFATVTFNVTDGYQTIDPINVTVTIVGANNTSDYDGEEHTVTGYEVTDISSPLYKENDFTFTPAVDAAMADGKIAAQRTDAGTTNMGLAPEQFANNNSNFATVTFNVTDGYQTINKINATVTIVGANSTDPYDGELHTVTGYTATASTDLYDVTKDFTFRPSATAMIDDDGNIIAARTVAGTTYMGLAEDQFENTNPNFATVTFSVTDGYQTITPIDVTVTIVGANNTTDYDGEEHVVTGYTATASSTLYDVTKDFTFTPAADATLVDGEIAAKRTDAGQTDMGLAKEQFENTNPNFATVTFSVTDGYQKIDPIDVTVTIVGANNTTDYDGNEHTVKGYTATADTALYDVSRDFTFTPAAGATLVDGEIAAKRTDAGQTDMGLAKEQFENTNPNFGTVTFEVTDGYQKIDPIDVTVTIVGANNTSDYDGEEHTVTGYTATASSTLYDVTKDFNFTPAEGATLVDGKIAAKRTNAGTTDMGLAEDQFENKNPNFGTVTFEVTDGYQTIEPIDVTVTIVGANNTSDYDGEEHTVKGYTATASSPLYDVTEDFTFTPADDATLVDGEIAAKRTDAGQTDMGLAKEQFENTNPNFGTVTFNVTDGYQTIEPINVTVTIVGANNTSDYDGEEHTVKGYTATASSPLYDVTKDFTFTPAEDATLVDGEIAAKRTNAGTTNMGLAKEQFENTNPNFGTVTFNVTDGYQTITPINVTVTITGHNNTTTYDSTEHTVTGYDVQISDPLYKESDFTFTPAADATLVDGKIAAKRTNVGTTNMGLAKEQFENTNENFATVTFNVTDGYQTITKVDEVVVTITGHNNTAAYDGEEHTVTGYDVQISDPLYKESDFTFTPAEDAELVDGKIAAKRTDAGTMNMGLKEDQFANTNENFDKVTFVVTDGYQTITPIDVTVTITGHNDTSDYDGEEHSVSGYDVEISNPLYKESDFTFTPAEGAELVDGKIAAKRTDAGTTDMGLAKEQFENTNPNFGTVTFNVTDGYQTISPINVTVTIVGDNSTDPYDGEAHTVTGYTATASTDLYDVDHDFTFSGGAAGSGIAIATRTNAGTAYMGLAPEQFTNTNPNFAEVTFDVTDGYQTITPINATVTIVGASNTTDYDGDEHTVTGYTATASTDLYDVTKDFTFTPADDATLVDGMIAAKRTNAGKTMMGLAEDQFENTNENFATVTFNVTDGYQEINKINATVTIVGASNTSDYDGNEHTVTGYTATASTNLYDVTKDFTFTPADDATLVDGKIAAKRTNAGKTMMGLEEDQFKNTNENFATVTFNVTDGYQEILQVEQVVVTITGSTSSVDYDGEEHVATGYTATADNTLYDVTKDFTFTPADGATLVDGKIAAKRTNAGKTMMGLEEDQFENTNGNFKTVTFNVTDGYQEIKPIDVTVTITGATSSVDYDGEEHVVTGYTAEASSTLYDVMKDFTFTPAEDATLVDGEIAAKRTNAGKTMMGLSENQFENTNENFKAVTFNVTDGYQEIKPIDVTVTITGTTSSVDYDGEEHVVTGYTAEASSTLYDVTKDFTFTPAEDATLVDGEIAAKRTNAGKTMMGLAGDQFKNTNDNFKTVTFNVTDGYQEILPIDVVVTIEGAHNSTTYDSNPHVVSGYTATASTDLYNVDEDIAFTGTAEASRTDVGKTMMGLEEDQFANTNDNFKTVTFNVTDGYQEIVPVDEVVVTITGRHDTRDYDGESHSVTGYNVESSNPLYTEADFTFTPADDATLIDGEIAAERTDAGKTMMGLAPAQFENKNANFKKVTFNVTDGYQEILPIDVTVTITGATSSVDYDGDEHTVTDYTAEASSTLYDVTKDFTFTPADGATLVDGKIAAKRTDAGKTMMGLTEEQFENVNSNFKTVTFNVTDGYQEILPIDVTVTITGATSSVDYDSNEHTVTGYTAGASSTLYDVTKDFTFTPAEDATLVDGKIAAKRTNAGKTMMGLAEYQFKNTNENFKTVTFNVTDGYQEILPIDVTVTITGATSSVDYNGEEHTVTGYDFSASTPLYTEDDFTFTPAEGATLVDGKIAAKRTNAGKTMMGLAEDQFANTNSNFKMVTFDVTDGYQEINPIDVVVTIVGDSNTTTYDGEEHTVSGYTAAADTDLYDVENDFTFTPAEDATLIDGEIAAKRTNEGKTMMGLAAAQFKNTNDNFRTVTFEVTDGYQEILPVEEVVVTITGHSDTCDYDGESHSVTGYDVTISNPLYTENDFTFTPADDATLIDGEIAAERTDAGKTDMGLAANQFSNTNSNFKKVIFNVTDGYQEINPIDVTVTITGASNTSDYDGDEHTVTGYTAEASSTLYDVTKDFTFTPSYEITLVDGEVAAQRTNAGTTTMGLAEEQFENVNSNFKTVTFNVTDGYQEIIPIDATVTITGHHNTATYDSDEHIVTGYDAEFSTPLYKAGDFTFTPADGATLVDGEIAAKRTNAGKTMMGLAADQFENTNSNFENVTFIVTDGYQEITPVDEIVVTITGHHNTTDYDGDEHTVSGYDVEISNPLYTEDDFTFTPADDATLVDGKIAAKRTNAGTTTMGLAEDQFANTNDNFAKVTFNVTDGYQTINKINATVTITGHNDTSDYDGDEHTVSGYDVTISTPLYTEEDFTFTPADDATLVDGKIAAKRTNAGKTMMGLAADQFANTNGNFATVTFNVTDGYQEINKINATVTIVGANDTKTYDSNEHSVKGYTAAASTPLYDVENDFTFTPAEDATLIGGEIAAKRTNAGTTSMGLAADQFANTNSNFETVTFVITDGFMKIDPVTDEIVVKIEGHTGSATYDSKLHTVSGYDVTEISNPLFTENNIAFKGTDSISGTNAGTYNMGLKESDYSNASANFTNVKFEITDGSLVIDRRAATITAADASKVYGTADPDFGKAAMSGQVEGELTDIDLDIIRTNKEENAGTYEDVLTIGKTADELAAEYTNYDFTIVPANFTIEAANITDSDRFTVEPIPDVTYNGKEQKQGVVITDKETGEVLEEGTDYELSYSGDTKNVGTVKVTITGKGNYEGLTEEVYLIAQADVTVTADNKTKRFGHEDPALTATIEGLVNGESEDLISYELSREAGESVDGSPYTITAAGEESQGNYHVTFATGELTITSAPIIDPENPVPDDPDNNRYSIDGPEDTRYNGLEQKQPVTITDSKTGKPLVEGEDYEIEYSPAINVGTVTVTIRGIGKYTGEFTRTYRITPAQLRIVTQPGMKVYDGTPLTAPGQLTGLVNGETVTFTVTGSQTAVGRSDNTYTLRWNGTALESNYEIVSETLGVLVVTAPPAPTPDEPTPTPTPTPTPAPIPGPAVNPTPDANVTPVTPINPEPTPQVEPEPTPINPEPAPKGNGEGAWALLNLIAAILTALLSLIMLIRYIGKKHKEEEDEQTGQTTETKIKKKGLARLLSLIPAIAAIITFILTEDMSNPWVWTDKWTLLMVVYLVVNVIMAIIAHKTKDEDDNDQQQSQSQQA